MPKNNLPEEYKDLINSSGKTLEELLAIAAELTVNCDNCALYGNCRQCMELITCTDIWTMHLMGVNNAEA